MTDHSKNVSFVSYVEGFGKAHAYVVGRCWNRLNEPVLLAALLYFFLAVGILERKISDVFPLLMLHFNFVEKEPIFSVFIKIRLLLKIYFNFRKIGSCSELQRCFLIILLANCLNTAM